MTTLDHPVELGTSPLRGDLSCELAFKASVDAIKAIALIEGFLVKWGYFANNLRTDAHPLLTAL
jgi:hypothetical protein